MPAVTALRLEWVRLQQEPVDQFWIGPSAFVERLLTLVEAQQHVIADLRAALVPFLAVTPQYGALQIRAARRVWEVTAEYGCADARSKV